jgi:hypothetical protein
MSFNDIESRLREELGAQAGRPLPSDGFEDRVRGSLTPRISNHGRAHVLESLVGLAAVLAIAVVALPWAFGPRSGAAQSTASSLVKPAATPYAVRHASPQAWQMVFDYPAAWTLQDETQSSGPEAGAPFSYTHVPLGFVGSGSATVDCPARQLNQWVSCTTAWTLSENSVVLRFASLNSYMSEDQTAYWTGDRAAYGGDIPGTTKLTIDGLPARFARSTSDAVPFSTETIPGADEVMWWALTSQSQFTDGDRIVAAIKGPNTAELEAEASALVASIHFVPEPVMLPTDPDQLAQTQASALKAILAKLSSGPGGGTWGCFPAVVGATNSTTITESPAGPLTKPLPVTCTVVSMTSDEMQGWILILTQSWDAAPDYSAETIKFRVYASAIGDVLEADYPDAVVPYPNQSYPPG